MEPFKSMSEGRRLVMQLTEANTKLKGEVIEYMKKLSRAEAIAKSDGCTCGNLVYHPDVVGNSGHMMDCPHYKIWQMEGEIVQLQFLIKAAVDNVVPLTGEYAKGEPEEWAALRRLVYPEG